MPDFTLPAREGILPQQHLQAMADAGLLRSTLPFLPVQFQPATVDLRLGDVAHLVGSSFLPNGQTVAARLAALEIGRPIDLTGPEAVLLPGRTYLIPLVESLRLPPDVRGYLSPRSSTGRVDVFARGVTDYGDAFDEVPPGYSGPLWVELCSQTFPIAVQSGLSLLQLRLAYGDTDVRPLELARAHQSTGLLFDAAGQRISLDAATIESRGLRLRVALPSGHTPAGWRARHVTPLLDLGARHVYEPSDFFDPVFAQDGQLVLEQGEFYLLATSERVLIPPGLMGVLAAYDPSHAEARLHSAGIADVGFGGGGDKPGTPLVLEVRAHSVPFLIEDGQPVARLAFEHLAEAPAQVYGDSGLNSHFQDQGVNLSRQFKPVTHPE